jgi:alpha 1,2-mannosyltransferase
MISLFPAALTFMSQNPDLIQPKDQSIMPWLITGSHFNFCSFVTDSEIMDLSFLRSKEYLTFFHYLDLVGGFFYE